MSYLPILLLDFDGCVPFIHQPGVQALEQKIAFAANLAVETLTSAPETFYLQSLADVILPQHCACGQLLERTGDLEAHVERGCWRAA